MVQNGGLYFVRNQTLSQQQIFLLPKMPGKNPANKWSHKKMSKKGIHRSQNRRHGKSHMWTLEIIVPAARGKRKAGELIAKDFLILEQIRNLFDYIDKSLNEINGGICTRFSGI